MSEKSHVGGPAVQTVEADADATGTRMAPIASTSAPAILGEVRCISRTSACESASPLVQSVRLATLCESRGVFAGQRDATESPYAQEDSERNSPDGQTFLTRLGLTGVMGGAPPSRRESSSSCSRGSLPHRLRSPAAAR